MNLVCNFCITDELYRQDRNNAKGKEIFLVARDSRPVVTIYEGNALCEEHFKVKLQGMTYRLVSVNLTGSDRKQ